MQILSELKKGKIKDEDLLKIKNQVRRDFVFSLNTASSVANIYGDYIAKGDLKPLLNYEENIKKLELKDLTSCAKRYFKEKFSTTVILKKA